ncbi:MAG TPA: hypothetical protein PKM34_01890, partial [Bacteroidales bacterium]|nr:hypothetical protein [Bacteroidales bacterium]
MPGPVGGVPHFGDAVAQVDLDRFGGVKIFPGTEESHEKVRRFDQVGGIIEAVEFDGFAGVA